MQERFNGFMGYSDHYRKEIDERDEKLYQSQLLGTSPNARTLDDIVLDMIERDITHVYMRCNDLIGTDIVTAVKEACIKLGLSTEDFSPYLYREGDGVDIYLYV